RVVPSIDASVDALTTQFYVGSTANLDVWRLVRSTISLRVARIFRRCCDAIAHSLPRAPTLSQLNSARRKEHLMKRELGRVIGTAGGVGAESAIGRRVGGVISAQDDDRQDSNDDEAYTIGLFGDMPYNALGKQQYPALLADINRSGVAFSVFDGDLKA